MFIFNDQESNKQKLQQLNLMRQQQTYRQYMFMSRFGNTKKFGVGATKIDPALLIVLQNMYDEEISKKYKFEGVRLGNMIFEDIMINNI